MLIMQVGEPGQVSVIAVPEPGTRRSTPPGSDSMITDGSLVRGIDLGR